jgi:hypothetical protein
MNQSLIQMLQCIIHLHDHVGEFINRYKNQALPNSRADLELNNFSRPKSLTTAYSQGEILIEVAADHLMAITKLLNEPAQTIAPWSCMRALIESCALGSWLLSSDIDAKTRVQRSLAFRYKGLIEQHKFLKIITTDEAIISKSTARIDEVVNITNNLGYPIVKDLRGGITALKMPDITTLVITELNEESLYRLSSAMIHDHAWALQQLSFRKVGGDNFQFVDCSESNEKIHALERYLDFDTVTFICKKAVKIFYKPVWYQCQLFGWEYNQLVILFENALNSLSSGDLHDPQTGIQRQPL